MKNEVPRKGKGGVHQKLIYFLLEQEDETFNFIGQELKDLKQLRAQADYKLDRPFSVHKA